MGDRASTAQSATGVAVIDLDPGQPEYAPAGTVSLVHVTKPNLGTPFSHPGLQQAGLAVLRSHALASVSPAMSPSLYVQCATDLYDTYRRKLRNCPLIINTPGWILGTGLDLLVELITMMMPIQVVYMSEDGPLDVVEALRSAAKNDFLTLPSQSFEYTARTGSQLRAMQAMSYFHLAGSPSVSPAVLSWNPKPLSAVPPWEVRYAPKRRGIKGILSYDFQSPPELFRAAIDGMVLAVVEIEDGEAFRDIIAGYSPASQRPAADATAQSSSSEAQAENPDSEAGTTTAAELKMITSPEGLPIISNTNDATLDPRYSRTLGLALVRGVDTVRRTLQLLSPITEAQLQGSRAEGHSIILVHGKFDAPTWAYAEDFFFQRATAASASASASVSVELGLQEESQQQQQQSDLDVTFEGEDAGAVQDQVGDVRDVPSVPWLEILQGNQKRPVGSGVWRVRRDLGRNTGE